MIETLRIAGIAVVVEKTSSGVLQLAPRHEAFLCIDRVELVFGGRRINEAVEV